MNREMSAELRLAVSVIIQEGERFLLVERANNPGKGSFAFPGGKVEPGETTDVAVRRELFEETALTLLEATLFEVLEVSGASGRYLLHVYSAQSYTGTPKAGDDAASFGWYSSEDMKALTMPQSVHDMVAKIQSASSILTRADT